MITRRQTLAILGAAALATPLAALGQQKPPRSARIGYLDNTSSDFSRTRVERLRAGLRDLGYVEGRNLLIEYRWAEGKVERLPGLAAELVRLKVEVIVASGTAATEAARRATTTTPIVMTNSADPVVAGVVASLARPGGNITGLSTIAVDLSSKYVELLSAAVSRLSRVAVLTNPTNRTHPSMLKSVHASAKVIGVEVSPIEASSGGQIEAAFGTAKQQGAGAMIVLTSPPFVAEARRFAQLAIQQRLPTLFWTRELVEAGGLMSYGQNIADHFQRAATYVDKILKGAKPADLPVEQPTTIELVINLRTAKAIGLTIPQDLLFRADRVIE